MPYLFKAVFRCFAKRIVPASITFKNQVQETNFRISGN